MKKLVLFVILLTFFIPSLSKSVELNFKMSLSNAFNNGYSITNASIILYLNDEYVTSKEIIIKTDSIACIFNNIEYGDYKLEVKLHNNDKIIASGSGCGQINTPGIKKITARLVDACKKLILITNWHPEKNFSVDNLYGFKIDQSAHYLKYYNIKNIETIALDYKNSGMNWFYPLGVNYDILDSNLVPLIDYSFGKRRNPVATCQTAFGFYNYYLNDKQEIYKRGFLNNVNWLLENHKNYYLHYTFEWWHYKDVILSEGWISAMAQGEALAAISMAYYLTGDNKYLRAAEGFFRTLHQNTNFLWCFGVSNEDYYWLEEYPNKDFCHVLNGMLYGLWGLWDYYVITGNQFALTLFQAGIKTIADNYYIWNIEDTNLSYYCKHKKEYSSYHEVHLFQLGKYDEFFDIPEFQDAIACFSDETAVPPKQQPTNISLSQNYPNPFNSTTIIAFNLLHKMYVDIKIYNQRGQQISNLINSILPSGSYNVKWDASGHPTGLYFYKIQCNDYTVIKKMLYIK